MTYTNTGAEPLDLRDPFHCSILGAKVVDTTTQQTPQVERGYSYGCTSDVPPTVQLKPREEYSGTAKAIIEGFPAGQYRLGAGWLGTEVGYGTRGSDRETHQNYPLTPTSPELRFEIR
ncbi:MAG: hypothetical protein Q4C67_11610 [Deinococcus sp.]|nr:hypothetical protein [Deinococcus sp.]